MTSSVDPVSNGFAEPFIFVITTNPQKTGKDDAGF